MVDDRSEDGAPAEPGRPKREPPTIDLKATDVSEAPTPETREAENAAAEPAPAPEAAAPSADKPASFAKCRRENFPNIVISGQRSSI